MTQETVTQTEKQAPVPNPDLKRLGKLIGTWELSGQVQGTTTFEWKEGGFFLIQHYDFQMDGKPHKGMEIIGHEHPMGGEPSPDITSRIYGLLDGLVQDYFYELNEGDDGFRMWMPKKGSAAYCDVRFGDDSIELKWTYPGGGYTVNAKRIRLGARSTV